MHLEHLNAIHMASNLELKQLTGISAKKAHNVLEKHFGKGKKNLKCKKNNPLQQEARSSNFLIFTSNFPSQFHNRFGRNITKVQEGKITTIVSMTCKLSSTLLF